MWSNIYILFSVLLISFVSKEFKKIKRLWSLYIYTLPIIHMYAVILFSMYIYVCLLSSICIYLDVEICLLVFAMFMGTYCISKVCVCVCVCVSQSVHCMYCESLACWLLSTLTTPV